MPQLETLNRERVVVKIGTDLLTCTEGTLNREFIAEMAWQVAKLRETGRYEITIVTSGGVAAGREMTGDYAAQDTPSKQALSTIGWNGLLVPTWHAAFAAHGINIAPVLLERDHFENDKRVGDIQNGYSAAQKYGRIILANENDFAATEELSLSNDILAALFARTIRAQRLAILSNIRGIYDANPGSNENAKLQRVIVAGAYAGIATNGKSKGGTGGAGTKLEAATIFGGKTLIAHGYRVELLQLLDGGKGDHTVILPADSERFFSIKNH